MDQKQNQIIQNNVSDINAINNNVANTNQNKSAFFDIYNRTYRLVAAVFVVVKLIDDSNDLRQRIEKLSLNIMSLCVQLRDANDQAYEKLNKNIERDVLELISFIDVAALSGFISPMNGSILKLEFQSFLKELNSFNLRIQDDKTNSIRNILVKKDSRFDYDNTFNQKDKNTYKEENGIRSVDEYKKDDLHENERKSHKRKDTRKGLIFDYIQKHNDVSIRDIVPNIRGCSEKTVQRELLDLVKEGRVKKVGERRWSRYSIV